MIPIPLFVWLNNNSKSVTMYPNEVFAKQVVLRKGLVKKFTIYPRCKKSVNFVKDFFTKYKTQNSNVECNGCYAVDLDEEVVCR